MYGIPSTSRLSLQIQAIVNDPESKEKAADCQCLAEVCRAICYILSLPRSMKLILACEHLRFRLIKSLHKTEYLLSSLPPEELPKMVYFLQLIFSHYRSKWYQLAPCYSGGNT